MPPTLDYAAREPLRARWGPVLIHPSRRTILLLLLSATTLLWIVRRHDPWQFVATLTPPDSSFGSPSIHFTPTNRLLLCGDAATLHDPDTGQLLHRIDAPAPFRFTMPLASGREVAQIRNYTAHVYDTETASELKSVPLPRIGDFRYPRGIVAASPIGRRVITTEDARIANRTRYLWDLDEIHPVDRPIAPTGQLPGQTKISFAPDGTQMLVHLPGESIQLLDARTLHPLLTDDAVAASARQVTFLSDGRRYIAIHGLGPNLFTIHDAHDGRLLRAIPSASPAAYQSDAIQVDASGSRGLVMPTSSSPLTLRVLNLDTGLEIAHAPRSVPADYPPPTLFPNGRRLFEHTTDFRRYVLLDTTTLRPVAYLKSPASLYTPVISPDNRHLAAPGADGNVHLYRQTGLECRESTLGLLGMPHTWLLIALLAVTTTSLHTDARRHATAPSTWLAPILLIVALPRTIQALFTAALGQLLWSPAPILLLCALGLAIGSRFWRLLTLLTLVASAAANLACLRHLHRAGFHSTYDFQLLDRIHGLPPLIPMILLSVATIATLPTLFLLARAPRRY